MGYMLRAVIFEDKWQAQLVNMLKLCREAGIKEVLFMEQSHQIVMVPYPLEKHKRMAEIYGKMALELRAAGVEASVNIASLVGHSDAPVTGEMVLPFGKFVGEDLKEANACYCILDEKWQEYAAAVCAAYATFAPSKIFIDDDFRSLNHSTMFGCFCRKHAQKTAKECGIQPDPKALLSYVTQDTPEALSVRRAWMKINFAGQLEAAAKMREAAEKVSPSTMLGLMNSGEQSHSIQGRDMDLLLRTFSGPSRRPVSRPAGGGYSDSLHGDFFQMHQLPALSMSVIGKDVHVVSEVENWPHTRFTKSIRSTEAQMLLHALAGAEDLTLNIYDYLATPYDQEPLFAKMLINQKDRISVISKARKGKILKGFGLPWKPDAAASVTCRGDVRRLMPERKADNLFPRFGIPVSFGISDGNALFGDQAAAYDDNEIHQLLKGGLMLDGAALEHLCARGFGDLLGCVPAGEINEPGAERLDDPEFCGIFKDNLLPTIWFRMAPVGKKILRLKMAPGARALSSLLDMDLNELDAPGTVIYENMLGGRVAVFSVPVETWQWVYRSRAFTVGKICAWLSSDNLPVWVSDCPDTGPIYYEDPDTGEGLLAIANGGLDPVFASIHTDLCLEDLFDPANTKDMTVGLLAVRFFRTWK